MKRRILYSFMWGLWMSLFINLLYPLFVNEEINVIKTLITTVLFIAVGFIPDFLFMKRKKIDKHI